MNIELTRYRVKPGKSERVDEWMSMLNVRLAECLATFSREDMYMELTFREKSVNEDFLYWFAIQGENCESVNTSEHDLDKEHLKFWYDCIDPTYNTPHRKFEMELQVSMIPKYLLELMTTENAGLNSETW